MDRILLLFFFIPFFAIAQVPQGVGYQVVATNNCDSISGFSCIGAIGSCGYYTYTDTTTWIAANILCINNGGSLVSINTIQESDSLNLLLGNNNTAGNQHWINLIDGSTTWENGEPLSFINYDGSYSSVSGDYMFLQNNGFWDNSPNDGSQSNNGIYPLMEVCSTNTVTTAPTISNAFVSKPIACNGQYAADEMQIDINQTNPETTYSVIIGHYMGNPQPPNPGTDYFISHITTNQTSGTTLNINGFLPNVDYFVRLVDSIAYYNANGGLASGTSAVGVNDESGSVIFTEPAELNATSIVVDPSCYGLSDGIITINISGGTPNYTLNAFGNSWTFVDTSFVTSLAVSAGIYPYTIVDSNNCLFNDIVNVSEPALSSSTDTIINCGNYTWIDGITYTSSNNTAVYTTQAINGCDSVITLDLTINNNTSNITTITACNSYTWLVNGATYLASGTYTDISTNSTGCTLTDSLFLTINNNTFSTATITACDTFTWNGSTYDSSGIYTFDTLVNYYSYDLDGVNDYIYRSYQSFSDSYGDNPFSFMSWVNFNGSVNSSPIICKDETNKKEFHFQVNASGYLRLRIFDELNNSYIQTQTTDIVTQLAGDWHNIAFTYDGSSSELGLNIYIDGVNVDQNKLMFGNYMMINPSNTLLTIGKRNRGGLYLDANVDGLSLWGKELDHQDIINFMQCSPSGNELELIYYWNFDDVANLALDLSSNNNHGMFSGGNFSTHLYSDYSCVLQSVNGCDSVAILNLTINNATFSSESITACNSLVWSGALYDSSGVYTYTTTNSIGCDSVHTLVATINYSNIGTSSVTACDSYLWNTQTITSSGSYNQTFTNVAGCDSVHTLVATINFSNTGTSSVTACDSYLWNTQTITSSGSYNQTFTNVAGCDSVHTLNITIIYSTLLYDTVSICQGESYVVSNSIYNNTGDYIDTIFASNGCLSMIYTNLTVGSPLISSITQAGNIIESTVNGGFMPYSYLWNTFAISEDINIFSSGFYWLVVTDSLSCPVDTAYYNAVLQTSISDIGIRDLKVYPNPTRDVINIVFSSNTLQNLEVRVLSVVGKVVIFEDLDQFVGDYTKQINFDKNTKGMYFLEIETNKGIINRKIILE